MNVNEKLADVVAHVFKSTPKSITAQSGVGTLAHWDSLGQVKLMFKLEQTFKIKFTTEELVSLTNVGLIQKALTEKKAIN